MKPLRAYANVLRYRWSVARRRSTLGGRPLVAYVEPTLTCHLACPACPTGLKLDLRPRATIAPELFRQVIDEVGDYLFELHVYNWGEPLLHKGTPEMIRYAADRGIRVLMSSNLSLPLDDERIASLIESGLDTLIVSIDGATAETYEQYRRQGDYRLVRENLRRLRDARDRAGRSRPLLVAQFLAFRHNEHEIARARAEHAGWGADRLSILPAEMPLPPHREGFEPARDPAHDLYDPRHPLHAAARERAASGRPCSWLYGAIVVNPNGSVSPCCGTPAERDDFARLGPGTSVRAAWNSERYRRARSRRTPPAPAPAPLAVERVDGMGRNVALGADELICDQCPIVFYQGAVDATVADVAQRHARSFVKTRRLRDLAALVLMGLPLPAPAWLAAAADPADRRERAAARLLVGLGALARCAARAPRRPRPAAAARPAAVGPT